MNIEAYNLDSLRRIVRRLFSENRRLKQQLKDANIAFDSENPFSESIEQTAEYDPDQGARINTPFITEKMVFSTMQSTVELQRLPKTARRETIL